MTLWQQTYEMARRSVLQTLRQPAMVIPPILFPLVLMAINVCGLNAATKLPGFPADSYLDFAIAFPFIQGSLFASINAGTSLARDVETGFLKRLAMTPMQRAALKVHDRAFPEYQQLYRSLQSDFKRIAALAEEKTDAKVKNSQARKVRPKLKKVR